MNYETIVVGLLSGVVSSFAFLALLFSMRPKVAISDLIARTIYDGQKAFVIKIINRTWWRLYDIQAELAHLKFENVTGGQNVYSKPLDLKKNHIWAVNSRHAWRSDVNAEYAVLFVCLSDLDTLWTSDSMLEFRVMARHSFSGFSSLMKRRFYRAQSSIREGAFKFGNSLEID
jgi:hypothetical protein